MNEPHTPDREIARRALLLALGYRFIAAGDMDKGMQFLNLALAGAWPKLPTDPFNPAAWMDSDSHHA